MHLYGGVVMGISKRRELCTPSPWFRIPKVDAIPIAAASPALLLSLKFRNPLLEVLNRLNRSLFPFSIPTCVPSAALNYLVVPEFQVAFLLQVTGVKLCIQLIIHIQILSSPSLSVDIVTPPLYGSNIGCRPDPHSPSLVETKNMLSHTTVLSINHQPSNLHRRGCDFERALSLFRRSRRRFTAVGTVVADADAAFPFLDDGYCRSEEWRGLGGSLLGTVVGDVARCSVLEAGSVGKALSRKHITIANDH